MTPKKKKNKGLLWLLSLKQRQLTILRNKIFKLNDTNNTFHYLFTRKQGITSQLDLNICCNVAILTYNNRNSEVINEIKLKNCFIKENKIKSPSILNFK